MKKKIGFVLIMGIFLFGGNVEASNLNKSFYLGGKFDNTFVRKGKGEEPYQYQPLYRNDGRQAYCLQPFKEAKLDEDYELVTENIPEVLNMSENLWNDIKLIMYYGYRYDNHKTEYWHVVTQILIWKALDPDEVFEFTKTNDRNNYDDEMQEILDLVAKHKEGPNFGSDEIAIKEGETITLTDTNNILKEYNVTSSEGIHIDTKENELTIEGLKPGEHEIKITKSFIVNHEQSAIYVDDKGSQIIGVGNDLPDYEKVIKVSVTTGKVNIDIKNEDNIYSNCQSDIKTIYGLYDGDELVETFDSSATKSYTSKALPGKTYQVKQISHACSDREDKEVYEVTISLENQNPHVNVNVSKNAKEIKIIKKAGNTLEANAKFTIGDELKSFSLTTSNIGEATIKIGYGTYTLKQISGLKNYSMVSNQTITINDTTLDNYTIELESEELLGNFTLNIKRGEHYYSNCSSTMETVYGLYDEENNLIHSFKAFEDNSYTLNNLSLKKYYLKQISHTCSDKEDSKVYEISLTSKKQIAELSLEVLENFVELTINKKYFNTSENKLTLEKDAVFRVTDGYETFTLTTNSKGNAKIKLGYGNYVIEEISGKENYLLVSPQNIVIDDNTPKDYTLELESGEILKGITVIVKDTEGNPIKGGIIALYKGTRKVMELTTNEKGEVCFANLSLRDYIIKEIFLPDGYQKEYFTENVALKDDYTITFINKRIAESVNKEESSNNEEVSQKEEVDKDILQEEVVPNTIADGDGKIIKFYSLLFTLILYTFYLKKA